MAAESIPKTMRAWQYTTTSHIENSLKLNPSAPVPKAKANEHLIKVLAVALNPVDYKPAEVGLLSWLLIPKPATPGIDVAGIVVKPAASSNLKPGQLVFGSASKSPFAGGALAEYTAAPQDTVFPMPEGLTPVNAAACPVAGFTAWQSILPFTQRGSRVFLNGGSGGTGTYGIQLAKQAGAHVTVSCSSGNVELCRSLGADEVLDYRASPLLRQLQSRAQKVGPFDLVVDNVFADPELYWKAHTYMKPEAPYVNIAAAPSAHYLWTALKISVLPGWLGGGKRQWKTLMAASDEQQLLSIGNRLASGEMRSVIDTVFPFEEAAEAFRKLKTGRAKGKIVIEVAREG